MAKAAGRVVGVMRCSDSHARTVWTGALLPGLTKQGITDTSVAAGVVVGLGVAVGIVVVVVVVVVVDVAVGVEVEGADAVGEEAGEMFTPACPPPADPVPST